MHLVVDNTLVARAEQFAERSFRGKFFSNEARTPLIYYIRTVAELVTEARGTEAEVAAAWLYNAPAVTGVTIDDIQAQFGRPVALIVEGLTDYPRSEEYGILEQMMHQTRKLMHRSPQVKLVRYADVVASLRIIANHPPTGWDAKQCNECVQGYWHLGQVCYGISPVLDKYYADAHRIAANRYSYA
jgi:guanosine-3',5'-bis(diphosphate) 3'-pyrophosphohydrolase